MSDLVKLLKELGSNAELEAKYREDREAVLDEHGIKGEERQAMLDEDLDAIRKLTGLDNIYMSNGTVKAPD